MKKNNYPTITDLIVIIGTMVISGAIIGLLIIFAARFITALSPVSTIMAAVIASPISLIITIIVALLRRKKRISESNIAYEPIKRILKPAKAYLVLWGFILLVAASIVLDPITTMFPESIEQMNRIMEIPLIPLLVCTVILAPIFEEILFRGIIQKDMQTKYNPFVAILISAFIFGLVHFNIAQSIGAFFCGLLLGYIFYVSKSIYCVIFVHMLNNLVSVAVYTYTPENLRLMSLKEIISIEWLYYTIYSIAIMFLLIAFVRIFMLSRIKTALVETDLNNTEK